MFQCLTPNIPTSHNPVYALIVGVNDYRTYDPTGTSDLPGAANDAESWQAWCRKALRLNPDQTRVLTGETADREAIVDGLRWLGRQVARSRDCSALFTFSGHGLTVSGTQAEAFEGMSLALGPADITPDLHQALTFAQIEMILSRAIAEERFGTLDVSAEQAAEVKLILGNITAVLDCCYSQPGDASGTTRALTHTKVAVDVSTVPVFARQLLACQQWETAYEIRAQGRWHGAFTWALLTMLEQWRMGTDDDTAVRYSRSAYGNLLFRTRELVQTLGLSEQSPTLLGDVRNLALLPFLRPGEAAREGWTSPHPDAVHLAEEFSSGNTDQFMLTFFNAGSPPSSGMDNWSAVYSYDNGNVTWTFSTSQFSNGGNPGNWSYRVDSGKPNPPTGNGVQTYQIGQDVPIWKPYETYLQGNGTSQPYGTTGGADASTDWSIQFKWNSSGIMKGVQTYMEASSIPVPGTMVSLTGSQSMQTMQGYMGSQWFYNRQVLPPGDS